MTLVTRTLRLHYKKIFSQKQKYKMPLATLQLSELSSLDLSFGKFDFQKEVDKDRSMTYKKFELACKPFYVTFKAILTSDSIIVGNFDGKPSFSLPVQLPEEEDLRIFDELNERILAKTPIDGWNLSTVVKEDNRMFLKISIGDKKALTTKVKSNVAINLKKPMDTDIYQGQDVTVTGQLGFYYNFDENTCGTSFTLTNLDFTL
jgi:hypothetical protein